jgi:cyclopropane fatty-acyl-phospholipid synthase-like methyltransferase
MQEELKGLVARSLEAEIDLLPYLPELLADLYELGAQVDHILEILRPLSLPDGTRVLDLGCGKGAVAHALADSCGFDVLGVDAMWEFVDDASRKAYRLGIDESCRFEVGDARSVVDDKQAFGLVCLLSLGPIFGDAAQTVAALRRCIEPGGYMLIDDGFLVSGREKVAGYEEYRDQQTTRDLLQSYGDRLVEEALVDQNELREWNVRATRSIAKRAEALAKRHPALAENLAGYVARQERETEILASAVVPAMWLLQKAYHLETHPPPTN